MNGDRDTKTPNSSVASPRKRVNGEGMLAVQGMIFRNAAALQESADICMLFLVRMRCLLRVCRLGAESYWLLFEMGQEWHHQGTIRAPSGPSYDRSPLASAHFDLRAPNWFARHFHLEGWSCCHLSKVSASGAPGTTAGAKQAPPLVILSVSLGPAGSSKDVSFRCPHTFPGKPPIVFGAYRPSFRSRVQFGRPFDNHWARSANRPSPIMQWSGCARQRSTRILLLLDSQPDRLVQQGRHSACPQIIEQRSI